MTSQHNKCPMWQISRNLIPELTRKGGDGNLCVYNGGQLGAADAEFLHSSAKDNAKLLGQCERHQLQWNEMGI